MAEEDKNERFMLPLFDGSNFTAWKFRMQVVLEEYELLECVEKEAEEVPGLLDGADDKAEVKHEKQVKREKRAKKERKCKSLLISRIHDTQLEYVQEKTTPKQIWNALIRVFERKSIASRMHLKRKMLSLRYESGSLQDHFLRFDRLVREYRNTGAVIEDIDVICHLLLTLGPSFSTVVTALETMPEEGLSLEFVKCRLLDEEIKRNGASAESFSSRSDGAAFAGPKRDKKKKVFKCYGCHQEGHKLSECPKNQKKTTDKQQKNRSKANMADGNAVSFLVLKNGDTIPDRRRVQWFIDSGCSDHLVNDEDLFDELRPLEKPIEIAVAKDGESIVARHSGTVRLSSVVDGEAVPCIINNVLFVPSLRFNLFSVLNVEMKGMKVVFGDGKVKIYNGSQVVATGVRRGKLYELNLYANSDYASESMLTCGRITKDLELWHRRFGHLNMNQLEQLIGKRMVNGLSPTKNLSRSEIVCEPCVVGKQTRKPFSVREGKRSSRVLEVVHSDVCGPVTPIGRGGEQYFVTFIDDWSHFVMLFPMKTKDEVIEWFRYYEALVTAKFGVRISRLKCDNGGEYRNKVFESFCRERGIQIEWTVPYTPEQNGTSERMNRTVVERARAMLEDSKIDKSFWVQAVQTAGYLVNRCPTNAIDEDKTPFECWEGKKPDVSRLRAFGSTVYVHVPKERRKKLDAKAWKGVFVGYSPNGYRVWNPDTDTIVAARDVDFVESLENVRHVEKKTEVSVIQVRPIEEDVEEDNEDVDNRSESSESEEEDEETEQEADQQQTTEVVAEGRPVRKRSAPSWHKDYELDFASFAFNALVYVEDLPESVSELQKRSDWPKWQQAMQEEVDSLVKNETWILTKLPKGRSAITCKWIFKIKRAEDDHPPRYKARLVARGFSQKRGFDYEETYSPVARLDTLRVVLALANREGMTIHQMDVKTAFLNGTLSEEIYMQQPDGIGHEDGMVCRLKKSLYGLKQASRTWNERFHAYVEELGFKRSASDLCLYVRGSGKSQVILVLYVDDVLVVSPSEEIVLEVKQALSKEFEMTDLGPVKSFLGMKIVRDADKKILRISQRSYLESLLVRFGMENCRPISTPMEHRLRLGKGDELKRIDKPYRELVGCIMYVSMTSRPDLAAAANYFSQFQTCFNEEHWTHLRRVLRYIQGTLNVGLVYQVDNDGVLLEAYSDADWANDITDRRSVSGAVFKVFGATVSWFARKQPTVSLSSTEAELIALCAAACHSQWLIRVLDDLGWKANGPVPFYEDNQSTIRIVSNPKDTGRLKHIDVKHFYVRELIEAGSVKINYVPSAEQQADMLTKGLPASTFQKLRLSIGILDCSV